MCENGYETGNLTVILKFDFFVDFSVKLFFDISHATKTFVQFFSTCILLCRRIRHVSIFIEAALQKIAESQYLLQPSHFYFYWFETHLTFNFLNL
jgi:hypothetical protein